MGTSSAEREVKTTVGRTRRLPASSLPAQDTGRVQVIKDGLVSYGASVALHNVGERRQLRRGMREGCARSSAGERSEAAESDPDALADKAP